MPSGILTCCTGPFGSDSLCLFGFCLSSLRCLISALTQAGGGDLLLRFSSSIQSCCREGGALQADVAVCGEHSPCSGQAACSFGGLSPGAARLFPPRRAACVARGLHVFSPGAACLFPRQREAQAARGLAPFPLARCAFSLRSERPGKPGVWRPLHGRAAPFPSAARRPGSQGFGALSTGALRLFPPRRAAQAARGLAPSPRAHRAPSLRGPSARRRSGLRKSLDRNWGLLVGWGGGGFSGAEFAPFPSPCLLPPVGMGRLFSGVSQSLCFANRRRCVPAG